MVDLGAGHHEGVTGLQRGDREERDAHVVAPDERPRELPSMMRVKRVGIPPAWPMTLVPQVRVAVRVAGPSGASRRRASATASRGGARRGAGGARSRVPAAMTSPEPTPSAIVTVSAGERVRQRRGDLRAGQRGDVGEATGDEDEQARRSSTAGVAAQGSRLRIHTSASTHTTTPPIE